MSQSKHGASKKMVFYSEQSGRLRRRMVKIGNGHNRPCVPYYWKGGWRLRNAPYTRFITLYKPKRFGAVKTLLATAHWEKAKRNTEQNIAYCSKDGDFTEFGDRPKVGRVATYNDAVDMVVVGHSIYEIAVENPIAIARGGRGLRDLSHVLTVPYEHTGVRGIWYWGPPGTGKSHTARNNFKDAYIKAQNKWFDGYDNHESILLEDFDHGGVCLKHYMKIWERVNILDEPFTGLDHATGVGVARELALLLISHEPELVDIVMGRTNTTLAKGILWGNTLMGITYIIAGRVSNWILLQWQFRYFFITADGVFTKEASLANPFS